MALSSITGMGCVSAAGTGLSASLEKLFSRPETPQVSRRIADNLSLPVFELGGISGAGEKQITGILLDMALREALDNAQLNRNELPGFRVGVCLGTTVACQLNALEYYRELRAGRYPDDAPLRTFVNSSLAEAVKREFGLSGPALNIANACASGADAIGLGGLLIKNGVCDLVIAGGADELSLISLTGFNSLGVCSPAPCRPFDAERHGLNLGEGAGIVILEAEEHAKRRGVKPEILLSGYGSKADGYHITAPKPDGSGLVSAICKALKQAELFPGEIAFVNAHGTGTDSNDSSEALALETVFGDGIDFLSTKRFTGHTLGAAGAIECIFTAQMLMKNEISASAGFESKASDINIVPVSKRTPVKSAYALSTSLAFGGCNSALILKRVL
ncbi:MAG: beta-ketoacyl-[acyl-carrier-protein] synthase family protein [Victivallaceae bacterium]|nr:beta-ketoacyl-[acyl-carrier-protein] synthase family protein [Victivallaceae bacterium]